MYMQMHLRRSLATATAHCALLPLQRRTYAPHTRSHAVTNSCCPSVEPQPLSLKGAHRHTRDSSCGSIGHCPPATIVRPNSPTFRPSGSLALRPFGHRTPRFGWDGPPRRSRSVTARVGDTQGRTERRTRRTRAGAAWLAAARRARRRALAARTSARADERACEEVM